jgi:hypothetical protein
LEYDLEDMHNDEGGDNENSITQKEIDWYGGWDKYHKLDENKKEYATGGVKVPKQYASSSSEQIRRAEARKNKEHNLK